VTLQATLSRGPESVSFPILNESGTPLIARSFGKPNLNIRSTGDANPRAGQDVRSGSETLTITTRLYDYETALDLADLVKAHSGEESAVLDIPHPAFEDSIKVFPAAGQEEALTLEYEPGAGYVSVELSLSRVTETFGVDSAFRADTPRATASGTPTIFLSRNNNTLAFETGVTIERSLGRPDVDVSARTDTDYPVVIDKRSSSFDMLELTFESESDAAQRITTLRNLLRDRGGRSTFTLDFGGAYGMGAFTVMPSGSEALRNVIIGSRDNDADMSVPQLQLRVVQ
jgi:hypothetical protein